MIQGRHRRIAEGMGFVISQEMGFMIIFLCCDGLQSTVKHNFHKFGAIPDRIHAGNKSKSKGRSKLKLAVTSRSADFSNRRPFNLSKVFGKFPRLQIHKLPNELVISYNLFCDHCLLGNFKERLSDGWKAPFALSG